MFDFGDELVIESYRIPWLIWIQLLVMLLLVILLYYFTSSSLDLCHHSTAAPSTSTAADLSLMNNSPPLTANVTRRSRDSKVGEIKSIKETGTSSSRGISRKEDVQEREGFSTKDGVPVFRHSHHPCHILDLAKQAFLKCLGLDSTSERSSNRKHAKEH